MKKLSNMFRRTRHTQAGQTFGDENVCVPYQLMDSLVCSRAASYSGLMNLGGGPRRPIELDAGAHC